MLTKTILFIGIGLSQWLNEAQTIDSVSWPRGTYGLPMTVDGCPDSPFYWEEGTRYHDTEDEYPSNSFPEKFGLAGDKGESFMEHKFCVKTVFRPNFDTILGKDKFPVGKYCIYKKWRCPTEFKDGYIKWDDEDTNNGNTFFGTVPDGKYDHDTVIYFCCREDGSTNNPILLPTADAFMLFPTEDQCQQVQGMTAEMQWYKWDAENHRNSNKFVGSVPFHRPGPDVELAFCYYRKLT